MEFFVPHIYVVLFVSLTFLSGSSYSIDCTTSTECECNDDFDCENTEDRCINGFCKGFEFDNDGIMDTLDNGGDNDGIPVSEANEDDEKGILHIPDNDDDYDGVPDELNVVMESDGDLDDDGVPDCEDVDDDNDGIPDTLDPDDDNDGIPDKFDDKNCPDIDGDGTQDMNNTDYDGDDYSNKENFTQGWYFAQPNNNCNDACRLLGLTCSEEEQVNHNSEVDSCSKVEQILESKLTYFDGFECDESWGYEEDVPNCKDDFDYCFVSGYGKSRSSINCNAIPYPPEDKQRLCYCN